MSKADTELNQLPLFTIDY